MEWVEDARRDPRTTGVKQLVTGLHACDLVSVQT